MIRKKTTKTLFLISIILLMLLAMTTESLASSGKISAGGVSIGESEIEELKPMFENILGIVQVFGSSISVIIIVVVGIKYMLGSVDEKAEMKQTATYYVIGAILVFSTVNVFTAIYNILQ